MTKTFRDLFKWLAGTDVRHPDEPRIEYRDRAVVEYRDKILMFPVVDGQHHSMRLFARYTCSTCGRIEMMEGRGIAGSHLMLSSSVIFERPKGWHLIEDCNRKRFLCPDHSTYDLNPHDDDNS